MKANETSNLQKNIPSSKRLKTLAQKILYPNLITIIVMTLVILVVFSLALRSVLTNATIKEVDKSRVMVMDLLRNELKDLADDNVGSSTNAQSTLAPRAQELVNALNKALRFTQKSYEKELFLVNERGAIVYPREHALAQPFNDLIGSTVNKLNQGTIESATARVRINGERFIISLEKIDVPRILQRANYLVIVASLAENDALVRRLSLMLMGIMMIAITIWSLWIKRLTKTIVEPIEAVSSYAKQIAQGVYNPINLKPTSTEMQTLYMDLNHMRESLQDKEQKKIDFLQNFSHDLRTPLMSIQGYAEGIIAGVFTEVTQPASIIAQESLRLKRLVDQLMILSRLESAVSDKHQELPPLNIQSTLEEIVKRYEGLSTKLGKRIMLQCEKEIIYPLNRELLDQVIGNILSNALRYADQVIMITLHERQEGFEISILDDGPGIQPEMKDKLFDRFQKGDGGNYGLGLAIAKSAVDKMGAELLVGAPLKGAQFICVVG